MDGETNLSAPTPRCARIVHRTTLACTRCGVVLQVKLRAGGRADDKVSVAVGSPRYIRDAISLGVTCGDGVDPVIRRLQCSSEETTEQTEGENDGASGSLSVRTESFFQ